MNGRRGDGFGFRVMGLGLPSFLGNSVSCGRRVISFVICAPLLGRTRCSGEHVQTKLYIITIPTPSPSFAPLFILPQSFTLLMHFLRYRRIVE